MNDLTCKGKIETLNLLRMVLRFAIGRFAVSGDLSQFYNCFRLQEDFWNLQRFLYRENLELDDEILEGVIVTLMYGVKCVSANIECAMVRIAKEIQEKMTAVAEVLLKGRYVDDLADSKATRQEVLEIVKAGNVALVRLV